jgi:hypothetical protein
MIEIPEDKKMKLLANGAIGDEQDHVPVLKLFTQGGSAAWIITEMMADRDTLFGLCDLGMGEPELGYVSLGELAAVEGPFGPAVDIDQSFKPEFPLSVYTKAALHTRSIVDAESRLADFVSAKNTTAADEDHPPL